MWTTEIESDKKKIKYEVKKYYCTTIHKIVGRMRFHVKSRQRDFSGYINNRLKTK